MTTPSIRGPISLPSAVTVCLSLIALLLISSPRGLCDLHECELHAIIRARTRYTRRFTIRRLKITEYVSLMKARTAPLSGVRDPATVTPNGKSISPLPDGVTVRDVTTHVDERGTVCEMFDSRWNWHPAPVVFAYTFSLRPGMIKGWGMHQFHDDRYFILFGELLLVLYDDRPNSRTNALSQK
jgi:hypothetical protein